MHALCYRTQQKSTMRMNLQARETEFLRLRRAKLTLQDFEYVKTIGRGAFGEVGSTLAHVFWCHRACRSISCKSATTDTSTP